MSIKQDFINLPDMPKSEIIKEMEYYFTNTVNWNRGIKFCFLTKLALPYANQY
jgi:hypothetical protein